MEGTLKRKPGKGLSKSLTFTILTHLRAVVGLGSKEKKWVCRDQDRSRCGDSRDIAESEGAFWSAPMAWQLAGVPLA